jgi:hypothetical protein
MLVMASPAAWLSSASTGLPWLSTAAHPASSKNIEAQAAFFIMALLLLVRRGLWRRRGLRAACSKSSLHEEGQGPIPGKTPGCLAHERPWCDPPDHHDDRPDRSLETSPRTVVGAEASRSSPPPYPW